MPLNAYEDDKNSLNNKVTPLLALINETKLLFCIFIPYYQHIVSLCTIALILLYSFNYQRATDNGWCYDSNGDGNGNATKVIKWQQRTSFGIVVGL